MKVLEGNPGKRPLKKTTTNAKPETKEFLRPDWLDREAGDHWNIVVPALQNMGLLTELDLSLFAVYCQTYADWVRVEKLLAQTGPTYVTPAGQLRVRPELSIAHEYMDALLEFSKDFGMTPASRARMNLLEPPHPDDEFQRWKMLDG